MKILFILIIFELLHSLRSADLYLPDLLSSSSCKGFKISNPQTPGKLGFAISGGGDINNDGILDFVISNYENPNLSTIYVIYGRKTGYPSDIDVASLTSSQGFKITGVFLTAYDDTAIIKSNGDVNGDQIADIVIGAAGTSGGQGAVYVVYGRSGGYSDFAISSLTSAMGYTIAGNGGLFAWNINSDADLNGDGIADIIIGAPHSSSNGRVYVIYGQPGSTTSGFNIASIPAGRGTTIDGEGGLFGVAVGNAGDFNGDTIDDLIIGAPQVSTDLGKVYVVYGKTGGLSDFSITTMTSTEGWTFTGASTASFVAYTTVGIGDFNNDGVSDVALGALRSNSYKGEVFVIYGKIGGPADFATNTMTPSQGLKISGISPNGRLGSSISNIGDVNGDGITDLIIGSKAYDSNKGAVHIIYGRSDQPSTIDLSTLPLDRGFKILGNTPGGQLGISVRNLGDINQDGIPDLIIGASGANNAFVLFGRNGWGCQDCDTSSTCTNCNEGYDYTFNGLCYIQCPPSAQFILNYECFAAAAVSPGLQGGMSKGSTSTNAANKGLNFWSPADALPFTYGQLKTSVIYMRYLNITSEQKLKELLQLYADADSPMIPFFSIPTPLENTFPNHELPKIFEKYDLPSSFIANFGDDFSCVVIIFAILIPLKLLDFVVQKWMRNIPILKGILHKLCNTLQNFLVGSLAESMGPITFYATLEYKYWHPEEQVYVLSPLICAFFLLLGLCIIILNILILKKLQAATQKPPLAQDSPKKNDLTLELLEKKYEGVAVLYEEFKNSSFLQQSAFLLFIFRSVTEGLIIGLLFNSPMAQAILLIILNLALLIYLIVKRPFKSTIDLLQQLVLVIILCICYFCFAFMAGKSTATSVLNNANNLIFNALIVFQFVPPAFMVIKLLASLWELCKWFKKHRFSLKKTVNVKQGRPQLSLKNDQSLNFSLDRTTLDFSQIEPTNSQDILNHSQLLQHQSNKFRKQLSNHQPRNPIFSHQSQFQDNLPKRNPEDRFNFSEIQKLRSKNLRKKLPHNPPTLNNPFFSAQENWRIAMHERKHRERKVKRRMLKEFIQKKLKSR